LINSPVPKEKKLADRIRIPLKRFSGKMIMNAAMNMITADRKTAYAAMSSGCVGVCCSGVFIGRSG